MPKFCGNCGKEVDPNAVVCVKCGCSLEKKATKVVAQPKSINKQDYSSIAQLIIIIGVINLVVKIISWLGYTLNNLFKADDIEEFFEYLLNGYGIINTIILPVICIGIGLILLNVSKTNKK